MPEVELPRRLLGEEDRRGVAAVAPSGLVDEVGEASYIPPIGSEGDDEPKEMAKGEREKRRERKEVRAIFSSSSSSLGIDTPSEPVNGFLRALTETEPEDSDGETFAAELGF